MATSLDTRHTLIARAIDLNDQTAWKELVDHYQRFIPYVLRGMNVPPDNIDDLTQQVLIRLSQNIQHYNRDRARFRTWLSSIIRNLAIDFFNKENRNLATPNQEDGSILVDDQAGSTEFDQLVEREWQNFISRSAMEKVRETFQGKAVEVFEMMFDGASADTVAQKTGLTVSTVYTLNKRVKQRLFIEIRSLIDSLE
ncbi:RNA polymerase sigma factor [Rubritalea spongiae]|uniref:RNA polymerase sigma factor n=1 Tax=Rubritalea spongiae TaxID=430797 RepID=A0ABW5E437_9BACT